MSRLTPTHITTLAILLLVAATLFRLGHVELRGEEPRRAVIALEMLDSGEYIVPHMSGETYYNKPPVFNWAVAACLAIFPGTASWMVRLPSLIAFFLTGLLTFLVTERFLDRRSATWAALFYLTSGELLFYGTVMTGEMDLFYSLIVFLQVASIFWFLSQEKWMALFVVSYALAGIGFLTKGLPSVAFQGLTIIGVLVAFGRWRRLYDPRHLVGILVFVAVTGTYFVLYSTREPVMPFLVTLFSEATKRTGAESKTAELIQGTLSFPVVMVKLLLPWSLLSIWLWGRQTWRTLWANPWTKFCLVFCAVNLPLYWVSGELRNRYVYMFFPFILVPLAHAFAINREQRPRLRTWTARIAQTILALLVVAAMVVPWVEPLRDFAGVRVVCALWAATGTAIFVAFGRRSDLRVPLFALALVVTRLAFDVAYLPAMNLSRVSAYPPHIEEIIALAGDEPVYLAGKAGHPVRDASIGPLTIGEVSYTIPPYLAYQIPWHYARLTGTPLIYKAQPEAGDWCLIVSSRIDRATATAHYQFHDHWLDRELSLIRWSAAGD